MDFGPALLVFSVAGGYATILASHRWRETCHAFEWDKTLFVSAMVGAGLFFVVRAPMPFYEHWPIVGWYRREITRILPFAFAPSLTGGLALGVVVGLLTNAKMDRDEAIRRAANRYGGGLLSLLHECGKRFFPVSLTMTNRKIYIGYVQDAPGLDTKHLYVTLVPTVSGYRDEISLQFRFTTHYWHVYRDLKRRKADGEKLDLARENFGIVLPLDRIESANRFDREAYDRYFLHPESPAEPGSVASSPAGDSAKPA